MPNHLGGYPTIYQGVTGSGVFYGSLTPRDTSVLGGYQPKSQLVGPPGPPGGGAVREWLFNEASGGNISVTTSSATQAGDLILVWHANNYRPVAELTGPTTGSWSLLATGDSGNAGVTSGSHVKVWSGSAAGGAQTITVAPTVDNEEHGLIVAVFTGAFTVDGAAGNGSGTTSTSHVAPSVSPTGSADVLLTAVSSIGAANGSYSAPGGTTKRAQVVDTLFGFALAVGDELLAASGATGTRTWTFSPTAGAWSAVSVAVQGTGGSTQSADAALAVTATFGAAADRTALTDAALAVTATISASAPATRPADAALAATATLTAAADRTAVASASLAATATLTAAATTTGSGASASLAITATVAAGMTQTYVAAAALAVTATLAAAAFETLLAQASLPVTATLTAAAARTQLPSAALPVTATLTAGLNQTFLAAAALAVTATLSASASTGSVAALPVTATLAAAAARTALPAAAIAVTATLTAAATRTQPAQASLAVTAAVTAAGLGLRQAGAVLAVLATLAAVAAQRGPTGPPGILASTVTGGGQATSAVAGGRLASTTSAASAAGSIWP